MQRQAVPLLKAESPWGPAWKQWSPRFRIRRRRSVKVSRESADATRIVVRADAAGRSEAERFRTLMCMNDEWSSYMLPDACGPELVSRSWQVLADGPGMIDHGELALVGIVPSRSCRGADITLGKTRFYLRKNCGRRTHLHPHRRVRGRARDNQAG